MQALKNILYHQNIVFGNTENGSYWIFQNADNQYQYSHNNNSTFTGKELDAETGFSYFGARYLDHTLTTAWLSVDPMADKYPSISPYAYCAWNPVKLVDPDGEWPWNPKHIRAAKRYARKTHGTLSVWNNPYGVQFASVSYTSLDSDGGKIFSYALFQPEGYSVHGTIRAASGLSGFELWLESPSESTDEIKSKTVLSFFYGIPNDVCKLVTGHTIAGSEVNSSEKTEAFVSNATSFLGFFLKSSKVITKVSGLRGLQGYNEYVKKNPGILKRRTRKDVGRAYKNNIELQESMKNAKRTSFLTILPRKETSNVCSE